VLCTHYYVLADILQYVRSLRLSIAVHLISHRLSSTLVTSELAPLDEHTLKIGAVPAFFLNWNVI
jgi:hypothetical protein